TPQFPNIALLTGDFDEYVDGVRAARHGQTPQLIQIAALTGQLNQLGHGVAVAISRPSTQPRQLVLAHESILSRRTLASESSRETGRHRVACRVGQTPGARALAAAALEIRGRGRPTLIRAGDDVLTAAAERTDAVRICFGGHVSCWTKRRK